MIYGGNNCTIITIIHQYILHYFYANLLIVSRFFNMKEVKK